MDSRRDRVLNEYSGTYGQVKISENKQGEEDTYPIPNSSQLVLPTMSIPDFRSRDTTVASNGGLYSVAI